MSWNICSYKDCMMQRKPCSSIAFFRLPLDEPRRSQWLLNCGNKQLQKLTQSQVRYFCELHFHPLDIVNQFNRKLLRKHAVPKAHASLLETDEGTPLQAIQISADEEPELEDDAVQQSTQWVELDQQDVEEHKEEVSELMQELEQTEEQSEQQKTENNTYCVEYIVEDDTTEAINVVAANTVQQEEEEEFELELQSAAAATATDMNKLAETTETQAGSPSCSTSKAVSEKEDLHDEKYASDKHFALSLVYYFQRLSPEKKARAKIQILTYLTMLDLGLDADLK